MNPLAFSRSTFVAAMIGLTGMIPMTTDASASDIVGAEWRLAELHGMSKVGNVKATLRIESGGNARGNGGCNSFGAEAQVRSGKLSFSGMMSTQKACFGAGMEVERSYFKTLLETESYRVNGGTLELYDAAGVRRAVLVSA